jgi:hypothetical protein
VNESGWREGDAHRLSLRALVAHDHGIEVGVIADEPYELRKSRVCLRKRGYSQYCVKEPSPPDATGCRLGWAPQLSIYT